MLSSLEMYVRTVKVIEVITLPIGRSDVLSAE